MTIASFVTLRRHFGLRAGSLVLVVLALQSSAVGAAVFLEYSQAMADRFADSKTVRLVQRLVEGQDLTLFAGGRNGIEVRPSQHHEPPVS